MVRGENHRASFPVELILENDQIHIWSARQDKLPDQIPEPALLLSLDERERASRFVFDRDRVRFIASHGMLRNLLGRYLGIGPKDLRFSYGEFGKPSLTCEDNNGSGLSFNMSHSHQVAVYAFARGPQIGIDVEFVASKPDLLQIAGQFFSKNEYAALSQLSPSEQIQGFFNCWTRKEAFVKALGTGLMLPLDQFDVSLRPGEPARLLSVKGDPKAAGDWCLEAFTPFPGYAAAIAVNRQNVQILQFSGLEDL